MEASYGFYSHFDNHYMFKEEDKRAVLSISGGGVRGILPLEILAEIEKRVGKKAGDIFSFMAGSSVGSLIASLLNLRDTTCPEKRKYSAKDLTEIIEPKIREIFHQSWIQSIYSIYGLYRPKYSSDGMHSVLTEFFGETKSKDLLGHFCFPSLNTTDFQHSYFPFSSEKIRKDPLWQDLKVVNMLEGLTAAPSYFSPKKILIGQDEYNIIDGGTAQNNPSSIAYAAAKRVLNCGDNMILISLGTGSYNNHFSDTNWGDVHWAPYALDIIFSGNDSATRDLTDQLLNIGNKEKKFYDIQFQLQKGKDALDDPSNIPYLKETAKAYIESDIGDSYLRKISLQLEKCV